MMDPYRYQVGGDHYQRYKYQPIQLIADLNLAFELGNAVKYLARLGHKGDPLEDLKKIRQYLDFYELRQDADRMDVMKFTDQIKDPVVSLAISAVCSGDVKCARILVDQLEKQYKEPEEGEEPKTVVRWGSIYGGTTSGSN